MALTGPDKALMGVFDRLAFIKEAAVQVATGGTDFWDRIDAASDETFENLVKGTNATNADAAISAMKLGDMTGIKSMLSDIASYCVTGLGLASFDAYLAARRLRLDARAADVWIERFGASSISAANVHGKSDAGASAPGEAFGDLLGNDTFTAGTDLVLTSVSASPVLARVTVIGASDWNISVDCLQSDGATATTITQTIDGTGAGGAVGDTYILGAEAVGSQAASGQKVISLATTDQFTVGEKVLVTEWTGSAPDEVWVQQEWGTIASISAGVSITLEDNLLHTYSTSGYVYPLFMGVDDATDVSGGAASDRVYFYPGADRRLKL